MEKNYFESIIGYEAIKLELSRILDQLINSDKYAALGVTEPHGLLLHGVPGVGKSTMAQSLVDACGRKAFVCRKNKPNGDFVNEITRVFDEAVCARHSEKSLTVIYLEFMSVIAVGLSLLLQKINATK